MGRPQPRWMRPLYVLLTVFILFNTLLMPAAAMPYRPLVVDEAATGNPPLQALPANPDTATQAAPLVVFTAASVAPDQLWISAGTTSASVSVVVVIAFTAIEFS